MNIRKLFGIPRNLNADELEQVRGLNILVNSEKFKLSVISGDTARFNNKSLKQDQEQLVKLLENRFTEFITNLLGKLGYPEGTKLNVDMKTGKVSKANEQPDTKTA